MESKKQRIKAISKPTVKLVRSDYQPSKSELQEEIILPGIEGKSLEQVAQKVLQPVNIKWVVKSTETAMTRLIRKVTVQCEQCSSTITVEFTSFEVLEVKCKSCGHTFNVKNGPAGPLDRQP